MGNLGMNADYATLRRLTAATAPNLELFWAVLDRTSGGRKGPRERAIYTKAHRRYRALTAAR